MHKTGEIHQILGKKLQQYKTIVMSNVSQITTDLNVSQITTVLNVSQITTDLNVSQITTDLKLKF